MISLLRAALTAIQALTFPKSEDSALSSTGPKATSASDASIQTSAIATLLVPDRGSHGELDTEAPFFELTDVESAMRHEGVIPPGHYAVFQDASGRLLLQEQGLHRQ